VILGMDWLVEHRATIHYKRKILTLATPEGEKLVCRGSNHKKTTPIIIATQAFKMLKKGSQAYLYAVEIAETREPHRREVPIVQEFLRVFQEVQGVPLHQELEFTIELVPGTAPKHPTK